MSSPTDFPDSFGDPRGEYQAARQGAALFTLPSAIHVQLTGRDRAKFLHNFCTNDVRGLATGKGCEAFVTNVQGKVLSHLFIQAFPDSLRLVALAGSAEKLVAHLSRYQITEDVEFADRSSELATLYVAGPLAPELVAGILPQAPPASNLEGSEFPVLNSTIAVIRNNFLALPGYFLVTPRSAVEALQTELIAGMARPAGRSAFDALRIEAGFPLYGTDITDANLAQEVSRTSQAISFTKGCYLGQEPIARIDALGHVNQELRGLRLVADPIPAPGTEVITTDESARVIGRITSAARSYADDRPVALALLRRGFETPGLAVAVRSDTTPVAGQVFWATKGGD